MWRREYFSAFVHAEAFSGGFIVVEDGFEEVFGRTGGGSEILGKITFFAVAYSSPRLPESRRNVVNAVTAA